MRTHDLSSGITRARTSWLIANTAHSKLSTLASDSLKDSVDNRLADELTVVP